jgi:hypothetical protein
MIVCEAIVLPLLFLTVALFGGLRVEVGGGLLFVPPPLMALVLGLMLVGVLVRTGVLRVDLLFGPGRDGLAVVSGGVLLATLFAAASQVFNSLTPEAGLLNLLGNLFYLLLLWNTLAARPDPPRLMRSLLVIFGGAFVFRYVVLAALYDPAGGFARRVVAALVDGVTLGALGSAPDAPATGYVAFFTTLLFLIGLALLPQGRVTSISERGSNTSVLEAHAEVGSQVSGVERR